MQTDDGQELSINADFYKNKNDGLPSSIKLNILEQLLRKKITLIIAASIFLLASAASVFLIYGTLASPTIASWLAPLSINVLRALTISATSVAGFGFSATLISGYNFFNAEKYAEDKAAPTQNQVRNQNIDDPNSSRQTH